MNKQKKLKSQVIKEACITHGGKYFAEGMALFYQNLSALGIMEKSAVKLLAVAGNNPAIISGLMNGYAVICNTTYLNPGRISVVKYENGTVSLRFSYGIISGRGQAVTLDVYTEPINPAATATDYAAYDAATTPQRRMYVLRYGKRSFGFSLTYIPKPQQGELYDTNSAFIERAVWANRHHPAKGIEAAMLEAYKKYQAR